MVFMQLLGWQIYLATDVTGSPRHPRGTNVGSALLSVIELWLTRSIAPFTVFTVV